MKPNTGSERASGEAPSQANSKLEDSFTAPISDDKDEREILERWLKEADGSNIATLTELTREERQSKRTTQAARVARNLQS